MKKRVIRGLLAGLLVLGASACGDLTAPPPDDDGSDKGPGDPRKQLIEHVADPLTG